MMDSFGLKLSDVLNNPVFRCFMHLVFTSSKCFKFTLLQDLRSAVLKICDFIGKKLSEEEIESVVRQATFENMQKDPRANYENMPDDIAIKGKGRFLRKGKTEAVHCDNHLIPPLGVKWT